MRDRAPHRRVVLGGESRILQNHLDVFPLFMKDKGRFSAVAVRIESPLAQAGFAGEREHVHFVELIRLNFQKDFVFRLVEGEQAFDHFSLFDDVGKGLFLWRLRLLVRGACFFSPSFFPGGVCAESRVLPNKNSAMANRGKNALGIQVTPWVGRLAAKRVAKEYAADTGVLE